MPRLVINQNDGGAWESEDYCKKCWASEIKPSLKENEREDDSETGAEFAIGCYDCDHCGTALTIKNY